MVTRWLLVLAVTLVTSLSSITAWAAAGFHGNLECCCPDPTTCKCHGHEDSSPDPLLKRCAGDGFVVAPAAAAAEVPEPVFVREPIAIALPVTPRAGRVPEERFLVPEKPPF
jgi:hypothetical protein